MKASIFTCLTALVLPSLVAAQLTGSVGPTTTTASKRTKVCNVLNYGGVASKTSDVGPAISSAFAACKSGGTVYVPPGDFGMSTWVTLSGGTAWALQIDGIIYRTGTAGGNMFAIQKTTDFEMYSSTSQGAIQGNGYEFHAKGSYGPRILRCISCTHFSVHDLALVDSPAFHFSIDTGDSGEIYNLIIRGGEEGGLDGIDVWGTNMHIHDVEVTNRDECVTVKNPSHNFLVENIHCNWSGGCAFGSLGLNTDISNIIYNNIYTVSSTQMLMIKSNCGSGTVKDCQFNNFIGHGNAYSLDIDSYWSSMSSSGGTGIQMSGLSFDNWKGTCTNGAGRGPVKVICPSGAPCTNVKITNFEMWTDTGSTLVNHCANAGGSGGCIQSAGGVYTTTQTVSAKPTGYSAPTMPNDLTAGFGTTASIPIPPVPSTYYPGVTPIKALLAGAKAPASVASSAGYAAPVTSSSSSATTAVQATYAHASAVSAATPTYPAAGKKLASSSTESSIPSTVATAVPTMTAGYGSGQGASPGYNVCSS